MVRSELQLEQNCPEETVAPSHVWREKIVIHEEEAPPELPTTPPSKSQDDLENGVPFGGLKNTERLAKR